MKPSYARCEDLIGSHPLTLSLFLGFLMKQVLEVSSPRVEVGFHFRRFPVLVVILGVPHLMPEVTKCTARLSDRAIYTNPNSLDLATSFHRFAHATMFKGFRENWIDSLNEI